MLPIQCECMKCHKMFITSHPTWWCGDCRAGFIKSARDALAKRAKKKKEKKE